MLATDPAPSAEKIRAFDSEKAKYERMATDAKADCAVVNALMKRSAGVGGNPSPAALPKEIKAFKVAVASRDKIRKTLDDYEQKAAENPAWLYKNKEKLDNVKQDYEVAHAMFQAAGTPEGYEALPGKLKGLNEKIKCREGLLKNLERQKNKTEKALVMTDPEERDRRLNDLQAKSNVMSELLSQSRDADVSVEDINASLARYKEQYGAHKKLEKGLKSIEKNIAKNAGKEPMDSALQRKLADAKGDYEKSRILVTKGTKEDRANLNAVVALRDFVRGKMDESLNKVDKIDKKTKEIKDNIQKNADQKEAFNTEINEKISSAKARLEVEEDFAGDPEKAASIREEIAKLEEEKNEKNESFNKKDEELNNSLEKHQENSRDERKYNQKKYEALAKKYETAKEVVENYDRLGASAMQGKVKELVEVKKSRKKLKTEVKADIAAAKPAAAEAKDKIEHSLKEAIDLRDFVKGKLDSNAKKIVKTDKSIEEVEGKIQKNRDENKDFNEKTDANILDKMAAIAAIELQTPPIDSELITSIKEEIEKLNSARKKKNESFVEEDKKLNQSLAEHQEKKEYYEKKSEALVKKYEIAKEVVKGYNGPKEIKEKVKELVEVVKKNTKELREEVKADIAAIKPAVAETKVKSPRKIEAKLREIAGFPPAPAKVNIAITKSGASGPIHTSDVTRTRAYAELKTAGITVIPDKSTFPAPTSYTAKIAGAGAGAAQCKVSYQGGQANISFVGETIDQKLTTAVLRHIAANKPDRARERSSLTIDTTIVKGDNLTKMYDAARDAGLEVKLSGRADAAAQQRTEEQRYKENQARAREAEAAAERERQAADIAAREEEERRARVGAEPGTP